MSAPVEAVIFDVDGTLLDSVDAHAQAWVDAFARFGKQVPFAAVRSQIGKGGDKLMPVFLSRQELEDFGEKLDHFRAEHFRAQFLPKLQPFPGVRELLLRLKAQGTALALGSSAKGEDLKAFKTLLNIGDLLDGETSSDDAERSKPDPDIFVAALEELGNPSKERTFVVGDTPYDAEAAGKAGLRTVGLLCGGFPADALIRAGCVALYRNPAELLARFDESPLARADPQPPRTHQAGG